VATTHLWLFFFQKMADKSSTVLTDFEQHKKHMKATLDLHIDAVTVYTKLTFII
jgi:hypothetical protein